MENKYNKEEEGVIAFLSWSNGGSIAEVTQEMKDALFPTISQLPESSKRMCYRMGSILIHIESTLHEFLDKDDEEQITQRKVSTKLFVENLELNAELHDLYLDFASIFIGLQYDKNNIQEIQDQIKLIVSKESN